MAGIKDKLKNIDPARRRKGNNLPAQRKKGEIPRGGEEIVNERGEFLSFQQVLPPEMPHGGSRLGDVLQHPSSLLALAGNDNSLQKMELEKAFFLDTETTGLAGGPGTFAFLVGLGYFRDGNFHLEQLFMRDFDEEEALLFHLQHRLAEASGLVTFNGKSYDWPLIKDKLVISRVTASMDDPLHLDLLHSSRRIFRERLSSCSLSTIEKAVLGFSRQDDIPGALIPAEYYRFLQQGKWDVINKIIEHNRWDIISMVSLLHQLCSIYREKGKILDEPIDLYSLARTLEKHRKEEECLHCYQQAIEGGLPQHIERRARLNLSFVYKRLDRWEEAISIWQELAADERPGALPPLIELAKYYEHQEKDYHRALMVAERALQIIQKNRVLIKGGQEKIAEVQYRIERLGRKSHKENSVSC